MANDNTLAIRLEARIRDFERNMAKANKTAGREFGAIERRAQQSSAKLAGVFASFGKGLAGGALAALAPMALFNKAIEAINDASHLVDMADKIGLSTTALQELGFGFSQAGVEAGEFETGIEQFTKRIGEAATKGGRLAEILKANGVAIRDSNGQIRSSESLLADYANLMQNAASEQERMVLATEAFGRGGAGFTVALKDGAAGIDNMRKAAAEAGGVIDEKLLRRAEEMGDRWDAAWRRFTVNAQSAILTALQGMDDLSSKFAEFEKQKNVVAGGEWVGSLAGKVPDGKGDRLGGVDARVNAAFLGELVKADDALVEALRKRYAKTTVIPGANEPGGGSAAKPDVFKGDRDAFLEMIGYTREYQREQEIANQRLEDFHDIAQDAGRSLVTALSDGVIEGEELLSILTDIVNQLMSMPGGISGLLGGLGGMFGGGSSFGTPGGFANMLGIPGYAKGTNNHPGGLAIVGEKGPELLNLPRGAQVIPDMARFSTRLPAPSGASSGQSIVMHFAPVIDARGADEAAVARLERGLAKTNAEMKATVVQTVRQAQKSNVKLG